MSSKTGTQPHILGVRPDEGGGLYTLGEGCRAGQGFRGPPPRAGVKGSGTRGPGAAVEEARRAGRTSASRSSSGPCAARAPRPSSWTSRSSTGSKRATGRGRGRSTCSEGSTRSRSGWRRTRPSGATPAAGPPTLGAPAVDRSHSRVRAPLPGPREVRLSDVGSRPDARTGAGLRTETSVGPGNAQG